MVKLKESSNVDFAKILSDGKFHINCDPDDEKAVKRVVSKEGEEDKVYYERLYSEITGKITHIEIKEGDYGYVLYIGVDDEVVISVGTNNNFGIDLLKKIPNIHLNKEVTFAPYSFVNDKGNKVKGVNVFQDGEKVFSYFQEMDGDKVKNINGFPEVDESKKPEKTSKVKWSKFWEKYFDEVEQFLVDYIQKNHTIEYVPQEEKADEEINPDDVPFD